MMVALLIYAYCTGERYCRKIEKHCQTDVADKVLRLISIPTTALLADFVRIINRI